MKIDLEKAYDRLKSEFITDVFKKVAIPYNLRKVIMNYNSSAIINVLWNGSKTMDFKPTRAIRQGDTISPYIFVLCMGV